MTQKIYLLPGTMCNDKLWHKLITCANEHPNHHFEFIHIPIPANHSFEQIADYLNAYLSDEQVWLLGFSLGGYIACYFAVNYPNRIKQLFIVGNSPCALNPQEISQRQELLDFASAFQYKSSGQYKGMSNKRAEQFLDSNNIMQEDVDTIKLMDTELGVEELISQMTYTTKRDSLLKPLSRLKSNMTFYYSEDDPMVNVSWLKQLGDMNSCCRLISTKGNSHMLPLEKPEELMDLLITVSADYVTNSGFSSE